MNVSDKAVLVESLDPSIVYFFIIISDKIFLILKMDLWKILKKLNMFSLKTCMISYEHL